MASRRANARDVTIGVLISFSFWILRAEITDRLLDKPLLNPHKCSIMVQLALIGCGSMAHWHAQQLQKIDRCKVVALVDPLADQTRQFKEKYFHEAAQYDSMENLLAIPP